MPIVTPHLLIERHVTTILGHLPGVFDGNVESVHEARIATRRLREALVYLPERNGHDVAGIARAAGRHLGRVRELDVMSAMLDDIGARVSTVVAVAALARHAVRERQRTARREMVKELDRLELEKLPDRIDPATGPGAIRQ
jgi:CHAD domain-containing protein